MYGVTEITIIKHIIMTKNNRKIYVYIISMYNFQKKKKYSFNKHHLNFYGEFEFNVLHEGKL